MKLRVMPVVLFSVLAGAGAFASDCEVLLPQSGLLPAESPVAAPDGYAWVGTPQLAALVPEDGHWTGMGPDFAYGDKWWWWRKGYRAADEETPELVISATRLDAAAPRVHVQNATNAFGPGWDLMLVGMEFPAPGCWEVVGRYRNAELRFVLSVGK